MGEKTIPNIPLHRGPANRAGLRELPEKLQKQFDNADIQRVTLKTLRFDDAYQGPVKAAKVNMIVARFSAVLAGTLMVNRRPNGEYYIMDGLHRCTAAIKCDYRTLQAYIFDGLTLEEEAAVYDVMNTARKSPTGLAVFRARLLQKLPLYVSINNAVVNSGAEIGFDGSARADRCVAVESLLRAHHRLGEKELTNMLIVMRTVWPDEHDALSGDILRGLSLVISKFSHKMSLVDLAKSLSRVRPLAILRNGHAAAGIGQLSIESAIAAEILAIYNKKRRKSDRLSYEVLVVATHADETIIDKEAT